MEYRDRHVVVTGGTGALGTATVAALTEAGAVCHVPYIDRAGAERFAFRKHAQVKLVADIEIKEISLKQNLFSGNVNDQVVVRMRVTTDINQFDGAHTVT